MCHHLNCLYTLFGNKQGEKKDENNSISIIFHLIFIIQSYTHLATAHSTMMMRKIYTCMHEFSKIRMKKKCLWFFKHWRNFFFLIFFSPNLSQNVIFPSYFTFLFSHFFFCSKWLNDKHFSTCHLISGKNLYQFLFYSEREVNAEEKKHFRSSLELEFHFVLFACISGEKIFSSEKKYY